MICKVLGGGKRDRTDDPLLAKQVLYQLSYAPSILFASSEAFFTFGLLLLVGLVGLEPTTPRLSSVCSNHLSYKPYVSHLYVQFTDKCECLIVSFSLERR